MQLYKIVEKWDNTLYEMYNCYAKLKYFCIRKNIKRIIGENSALRNSHSGERCFIVLNGPSLRNKNLESLKNEYVIATNYFYQSELSQVVQPNMFCWLDSKDISSSKGQKIISDIRTKFPDAKMMFNIKGYQKNTIENLYYSYNKHLPHSGAIKNDFSSMCSGFKNVAFYAINLAIYMGFKHIYILGLDFEPTGFAHFENFEGDMKILNTWNDRYEICDHYWGYAQQHVEAYAVEEYAIMRGANVINLNPNSYIRAFKFDEYENIK